LKKKTLQLYPEEDEDQKMKGRCGCDRE